MARQAGKSTKKKAAKKKAVKKKTAIVRTKGKTTRGIPPEDKPLTAKEADFVDYYLVTLNGTKAAIEAKYAANSATSTASNLLVKPNVAKAIATRREELRNIVQITQEEVVREYVKLGFSNIGDYLTFDADGVNLKFSEEMEPDQLACVAEISSADTKFGTNLKFKLHDKRASLDSLAKTLGMFEGDDDKKKPSTLHISVNIGGKPVDVNGGRIIEGKATRV